MKMLLVPQQREFYLHCKRKGQGFYSSTFNLNFTFEMSSFWNYVFILNKEWIFISQKILSGPSKVIPQPTIKFKLFDPFIYSFDHSLHLKRTVEVHHVYMKSDRKLVNHCAFFLHIFALPIYDYQAHLPKEKKKKKNKGGAYVKY